MKRIGIIGAGTMGIDVTIDALFHEFQVVLVDINNTALKSAKKKIVRTLRMGTMISQKFGNYSKDYVNEHLVITQNIDDVKKCNVIVKNLRKRKRFIVGLTKFVLRIRCLFAILLVYLLPALLRMLKTQRELSVSIL